MVIAFCTTCMDRRWQLEQTLPRNLEALRSTGHLLAICDYNSRDDVGSLVRPHLGPALLYFRTEEPTEFHAAVAKNTAHRLALRRSPDVLFNLDADNFVTRETIELVEEAFASDPRAVVHHWSRDWHDGSFGRIAMGAAAWAELGGYDESFHGMAWQDIDLLFRARAVGLRYRILSDGLRRPIPQTPEQKLANLGGAARNVAVLNVENFARSMRRPLRLPLDGQRRFRGQLGFTETVVV